jgi:hypothetical protein
MMPPANTWRRAVGRRSGFLLKRTRPEELLAAIHAVAAGDSLLP